MAKPLSFIIPFDWASKVLIPERLELHIRPPTPEEEAATEAPAEEGGAE